MESEAGRDMSNRLQETNTKWLIARGMLPRYPRLYHYIAQSNVLSMYVLPALTIFQFIKLYFLLNLFIVFEYEHSIV